MAEPRTFDYACHVRWSDVDAYGHVNNVKYFEYFQESRIAFIHAMGARGDATTFVVAKLAVDYKRPIFFRPEPYVIRTALARVGTSSFDLDAQILDDDTLLSRSTAVVVSVDPQTHRARPLDDAERAALTPYLGS